jgi:hypothetical protein
MKKTVKRTPNRSEKKGARKIAEYREFIRFIALSRVYRMEEFGFETLQAFAQKFKVSPDTLSDWQKKDEFWVEVKKCWKQWGRSRTPDVIHGLYRTAVKSGKAPEVLAWMKIVEDWIETTKVKTEEEGELVQKIIKKMSK